MKKILAIALVICMMMTFASFPVSAAIVSPATLTVVSAPGARNGYTGEKALDGDYKIGYAINNYNGSISTNNAQTLVYDLGKVTTLDSLTLYWGDKGQTWGHVAPEAYKVFVSKDNSNYTELFSYTGLHSNMATYGGKIAYTNTSIGTTGGRENLSAVVTELDINAEEVRYIKIQIVSFIYRACLAEIEATILEEEVDDGPVGEPIPATLTHVGGYLTTPHIATKYPIAYATDGDPNTAYVNGQYKESLTSGLNLSLIYKFDEIQTLQGLTIGWGDTKGDWGCQAPDAYNVYVSSDGNTYRKILTYTGLYSGAEYEGKVVHHNTSDAYRRLTVTETDLGVKDVMYIKIEVTAVRYRYTINEISVLVRDKSLALVPTTYTVNYVDESGKAIAPSKTGEANVGDVLTEKPVDVEGYKPNDVSKRITLIDGENVITFVYRKIETSGYTVNYVDEAGNAVATKKVVSDVEVGTTASESAVVVDGYLRDSQSAKEFIVTKDNADITFTYTKIINAVGVTVPTNTADSAYIIDGKNFDIPTDTTKQWKSDTLSSTGDGTTPLMTLVVDLGDAYDVTKYATTQANRYMKYVKFYASNDGQNWTDAIEADPAWKQETSNQTWYTEGTLDFGGAYRYIKLEVMTVANATNTYMNVYELAFVGVKGIAGVRENLVIKGGQIRLPNDKVSAGLRFGATLQKSFLGIEGDYKYDANATATFGMFVMPKDLLAKGQTLANYLVANDYEGQALKVPATKVYAQDGETVTFTAVLTNIPAQDYGRDIVAVAYVCIDGKYAFANEVTKNYMGVAQAVVDSYKAGSVNLTATQLAALEEIVGSL